MTAPTRLMMAAVLVTAWATSIVVTASPGAAEPQGPAAPETPAQAPQPPAGRGRQGGGGGGGGGRGGFAQFTRPPAPQDVLLRGEALYNTNCASCHADDLRGTPDGTNLLRSGVALRDQQGELITAAVGGHSPALTLIEADTVAIAEYIHSVHSRMGRAGRPPDNPGIVLDVLVGDAATGEKHFNELCASCHSVTGDLSGIGSRFPDARALQNAWVSGSASTFGGGRGRGGGGADPVVVTMADGSTLEGTLVRKNDFLVTLTLPDGTRRSIARVDGIPQVEVDDPQAEHKAMALDLAFNDPDNSKMYDITAYLWTIK